MGEGKRAHSTFDVIAFLPYNQLDHQWVHYVTWMTKESGIKEKFLIYFLNVTTLLNILNCLLLYLCQMIISLILLKSVNRRIFLHL